MSVNYFHFSSDKYIDLHVYEEENERVKDRGVRHLCQSAVTLVTHPHGKVIKKLKS